MENMETTKAAMALIDGTGRKREQRSPVPFEDFVELLLARPAHVLRNVFQVFHDMVKSHVKKGPDEYPDDPESVGFIQYDCNSLFVDGADNPFFADRIFANRLMYLANALKGGAQQNKIYIFDGPPGCGKSTFLNNLLSKFEAFANGDDGMRYETVWRLDRRTLGDFMAPETNSVIKTLSQLLERERNDNESSFEIEDNDRPFGGQGELFDVQNNSNFFRESFIEAPCPSHDHPILMIPKESRRRFLWELLKDHESGKKIFVEKEYGWIFRDNPCTICSSLFDALLDRLGSPVEVFQMMYVRPYRINRRLGEGISVYNPGDRHERQHFLTNPMVQKRINALFKDSNLVRYIFSRYAKTNNGIYALMDIKSNNSNRLIRLHNIISEGVHKVEHLEENVCSLFLAVMNPEDRKEIKDIQSFSDRIEYINISYIMDLNTEVEIYRGIFGKHIDNAFLPRVLHNFARIIISSRLNPKSEALLEWIGDPGKYRAYCDENLQLLKMALYTGFIPPWLSEEDRKSFNKKRRRNILAESEAEGQKGFSGRDSINIFNEFYSTYAKEDKLINMSMLFKYFNKIPAESSKSIPEGFLDSLLHMYNYTVLEEVKGSLYYYNEKQISNDIQNYLFALNFEPGTVEICRFTGDSLEITEEFLQEIESRLLDGKVEKEERFSFRKATQKEYASKTLTQEIILEGKSVVETILYQSLYDRYVHNLKERVLEPFEKNENFRRAIKDYAGEDFKAYDKKIRDDVTYLINNLSVKHNYSDQGAKEICIYVIDNELAKKFSEV